MLNNLENFVWPIEFSCTLITEKIVLPNSYTINLVVDPLAKSQEQTGIGFRKIRHFVEKSLQNSIIINQNNSLSQSFENIDTNVVRLPVEPYDYFLGAILYCKFLSICDRYFNITQFRIDSSIGDHVQYNIRNPLDCGLDLHGEFWWNMDTTDTGNEINSSWNDLEIKNVPKFEPRIIQGGLSEN
jgi:hypothetical protein